MREGSEPGNSYDHATYLSVHFRDGTAGAFTAIGFSGPVRGYAMLFSSRNGFLEPLEVRRDNVDWGTWSIAIRGQPHKREMDAELMELILDRRRGPEEVVKVAGCQYRHTTMDIAGYFELLRVSSRRIERLFGGSAADGFIEDANGNLLWGEHQYWYVNRDGADEIGESVSACECDLGADCSTKTCKPSEERTYRFNGSTFALVH